MGISDDEGAVMAATVTIGRPGQFAAFEQECLQAMERASLRASDRASRNAVREVRSVMRAAGLGRLGNAIGSGSDQQKNGMVHRKGQGFTASGWVHIRGKSKRTLGAIESYTEGAQIRPRKGGWLAIATPMIPQKVAGNKRMTPELYKATGWEQRLGPLKVIPGRDRNERLLVVENVSADRFGRTGRGRHARKLPKRGALGPTRVRAVHIVAFVLIRQTSREARLDPRAIIAAHAANVPAILADELEKER